MVALAQQRDQVASWPTEAERRPPWAAPGRGRRPAFRRSAGGVAAAATAAAAQHAAAPQRDELGRAVTEAHDLLREAVDVAQSREPLARCCVQARIRRHGRRACGHARRRAGLPCLRQPRTSGPGNRRTAPVVTREDEESAEHDAADADEVRATVEAGLASLVTRQAVAAAAAGGIPVDEITTALTTARQELDRLTASANGLDKARDALAAFEAEARQASPGSAAARRAGVDQRGPRRSVRGTVAAAADASGRRTW